MDYDDVTALVVLNGTRNLTRSQDWDIRAFVDNKRRLNAAATAH